jgi:soluble lytic murein transglycosylase
VSPSTATATRRQSRQRQTGKSTARRRATVRRRRRGALGLVLAGLAVLGVLLAIPIAKQAVNELGLPLRYPDVIRQQATQKRLDPALVAAVIYAETKFDPRTSSAGAVGLMQILPQTAQFLAHRSGATTFTTADLSQPQVNIAYGSYYLRYLLDEYHGSRVLALAAYNGGEANVDRWMARAPGGRLSIEEIPFPETRAYVRRVLQARADYRHKYAGPLGYD